MHRTTQSSKSRFRAYVQSRKLDAQQNEPATRGYHGSPRPKKPRARSFITLIREFWKQARGHQLRLITALATLSIATVIGLALPYSTKIALDYILTENPGPAGLPQWVPFAHGEHTNRTTLLWLLSAGMITVTFTSLVFSTWGRWQTTRATKLIQVRIRRTLFEHVVRFPLSRIYQIKSGGASSILREDAGAAAELLFSMIYNPWRAIIQLAGTLIILALVDWKLLLGALMLVPTIWLTHRAWIARIRPVYRDIREARSQIDAHAAESFSGMRIVRGFARETGESARFAIGNHYMARQELLVWWWSRSVEIAWQMLVPVASTAVLLYGGSRVIQGSLTIGDVMMFSAYLLMLLGPLQTLVSSATSMQNSLSAFDRVLDLFEEPQEFSNQSDICSLNKAQVAGRLTLSNVSFTYPGSNKPVINNVSLDIQAGSTVALVGPSGAGKTTLCNLIARFYDLNGEPKREGAGSGTIVLDGTNVDRIDVSNYRSLLGIVEQDVFLFDGSIAQNIGYARRGATDEQILSAATIANAHTFISELEHGYDTIVGERGVRLSGGQKQRIAIARAILADPRILILDEATSNLDSESEKLIQQGLTLLMKNRTSIVIAHRLSTIRHADEIVVIEQGQILEQGPHAQLLEKGGRYADFLRLQLQDDETSL